jgi:hypothetical protein
MNYLPLLSSSKFAIWMSVIYIGFTIVATAFSPPASALRDHFILGELLGAPMTIISGALLKRHVDKRVNRNK